MTNEITWPKKTREFRYVVMDSTRWEKFEPRAGDVYIATFGKSGSTWTTQIVAQLLFDGEPGIEPMRRCIWPEFRLNPLEPALDRLAAQTHRRMLKTHMPVDAIGILPNQIRQRDARHPRRCVESLQSLRQRHAAGDRAVQQRAWTCRPTDGASNRRHSGFLPRLSRSGRIPVARVLSLRSIMVDVRNLPNVLPVHFNNLKADLPGQIRRIAGFLDVDIDETSWPRILEHCGFDYMRSIMAEDEMMASMWTGGGRTFINKGTNGRWKDVLTSEEIAKAELLAAQHLTPECARWLATGAMAD